MYTQILNTIFLFLSLNLEFFLFAILGFNSEVNIYIESILILFFVFATRRIILNYIVCFLLTITIFIDGISSIFPNLKKFNLFDAVNLVSNLTGRWLLFAILIFLFFLLAVIFKTYLIRFFVNRISSKNILLLLLMLLSILIYEKSISAKKNDLIQSSIVNYFERFQDFGGISFFDYGQRQFLPWTERTSFDFLLSSEKSKKALIIVESWGIPSNRKILNDQIDVFKKIDNADIIYEEVKFSGSTIHAEFRELCKITPQSTIIKYVPNPEECLPHKLKNKKYRTVSLHAGRGEYYGRNTWYPLVGFDSLFFFENDEKYGKCYSWEGYCDVFFVKKFIELLKSQEKVFVYWMTLNSHSPYDERDIKIISTQDCLKFNESPESGICRNYIIVKELFVSLADSISNLEDLDIYIVGDHAPPFFSSKERDSFGMNNLVPSLKIKIKNRN